MDGEGVRNVSGSPTVREGAPEGRLEELISVLHDAEEDDELLRGALVDPANSLYTAWLGAALVGAVVVRWRPGLSSEILYLGVDAPVRGRGHGRRLLEHVKDLLPRHGRRLLVGTATSSLDNLAFYQRCGFRMSAVKKDHFDYVEPGTEEFGIPLRDMIVFEFETPITAPAVVPAPPRSARRLLDDVEFLLVPGGTRAGSDDNIVLRAIDAFLPRSTIFTSLASLPQFNPDRSVRPPSAVELLREEVGRADVVVFCTPEYAGSLPGSLKNLLDWTVGSGELRHKPVAWIKAEQHGRGDGASAALGDALRHLGAVILEPGGVHLPLGPATIGLDGQIADVGYRLHLELAMVGLALALDQSSDRATAPAPL
jgi:NAD(P)H-dependent FMN reductase/GNAT superfamily N-acetyltransferase